MIRSIGGLTGGKCMLIGCDRRLRAVGTRLPEAQNLSTDSWQGNIRAALPPSREDVTRRQHTGALHEGRFVLRVFVRSLNAEK
jgi:hypothetical protein